MEAERRDHLSQEKQESDREQCPSPPPAAEALPLAIPRPAAGTTPDAAGVSQTLIHLFSLFREQRSNLLKWLGGRSYEAIVRKQKKTPRRGTILDKKIE